MQLQKTENKGSSYILKWIQLGIGLQRKDKEFC